jgi:DNA repair protein RadC
MRLVIKEEGVEYPKRSDIRMRTPENWVSQVPDAIRYANKEMFMVANVSAKNYLISLEVVTMGILDASLIHPREVFRQAIVANAAAVLVGHNHPSGDPTPSNEDIRLTRQLVEAGKVVDIRVMDHIIVGADRFVSFREQGLVNFS